MLSILIFLQLGAALDCAHYLADLRGQIVIDGSESAAPSCRRPRGRLGSLGRYRGGILWGAGATLSKTSRVISWLDALSSPTREPIKSASYASWPPRYPSPSSSSTPLNNCHTSGSRNWKHHWCVIQPHKTNVNFGSRQPAARMSRELLQSCSKNRCFDYALRVHEVD
jgi:hypothetical protein